jgi:F-type H+-transporting ATPase subunit b
MELFNPDIGLLFWMLLSFAILFAVLRKYAWPAIIKGIDERNKHINSALNAADLAQKRLDEITVETTKLVSTAREEQVRILQEGNKIRETMLSEAKEQAKVEASKIIEDAHKFIALQREEMTREIDKKVVSLSIDLAEVILRKNLENPKEQKELVERLVNELDKR